MLKKLWEKYDQIIFLFGGFIGGWMLRGWLMSWPIIGKFFKP